MSQLTDGTWLWRSDLAYYVERYLVGVPADLVEHARRQSWRAPTIADSELLMLEARALIHAPDE